MKSAELSSFLRNLLEGKKVKSGELFIIFEKFIKKQKGELFIVFESVKILKEDGMSLEVEKFWSEVDALV